MQVEDTAPAFLYFMSPYGGLGLKTKSAAGARARIDGLLKLAGNVTVRSVELSVWEPAGRGLVEKLLGAFGPRTAYTGSGSTRDDLAMAVAAAGHTHDELVEEAWRRFGAPNAVQGRQEPNQMHIGWQWFVEKSDVSARKLDEWFPYLVAHDQLMRDEYSTRVEIHAVWRFQLRSTAGTMVAAPYPESEVAVRLRGRHASAFFDLVFPYTSLTADFLRDHDAVCKAMGLTLPIKSFRLNAPRKRGPGRVRRKV